ncbi:TRAP transporter large permease [Paracoccus sp. M683]|uniref:TRAP transporter large permease n=1 Tax=Paracoccus sp. M683 TaxID=2594268 RepID=UPI0011801AD9|nr:TRAP transporter large permease [Paracoccus sp. M683]TRW95368.1 TRAP transporter large permease [Paracoccus sp. M683]
MTGIIIIAILLVLLLSGIPIFVALMLTGSAILLWAEGSVESMADTVFSHLNSPVLLTIPLFILMAQLMIRSGAVDDLFEMANTLVGHVKGGIGVATILSCTIFAAISGSSVATAVSIGQTAIPQMKKFGFPERSALGLVAAGGTLGILIPPSGPMILYAVVANASIGALFLAGIIPGLLLALIFAVYCLMSARRDERIESAPFPGWGAVLRAMNKSIWALMMPPVVMGGIYFGIFTATEAAAVGCFYALLVGLLVYRNLGLRVIADCLKDTVLTSLMVFAIIAGAAVFGNAITIIRLPNAISEWIVALNLTPLMFMLIVMAMIFVMGMFLESIAIILITTPILLPSMHALGIDPIWYGVLLMINLELAMITPPVGMNLFVIKGITQSPLSVVIRGAAPFVLLMIGGMLAIMAVPGLATWLPQMAGFRF